MPSFPVVSIELSDAEREQLESWSRRQRTANALAQRSKIVLLVAQGLRTGQVAERLDVHRNTVAKWRRRFQAERLDGLVDEPRPGRPRTVSDCDVDEVITKTLESAPKDATHWSTRSMAAEVGLTQSAVHRIWRAFGLQPHRADTFKLSKDPQFVAKVRDVVGLYLDPPERAVVLASMRSPRSRRWIARSRSCRCSQGCPSAPRTTTSATAPQASTRRWTSAPAR